MEDINKYNHKQIEEKWLKKWSETLYNSKHNYTKAKNDKSPKFAALDTFAYPSAEGIHVGYIESYGATDIVARYYRMKGFNVFYPMGFDTLGLPAENYAIKTGIHPKDITDKSIQNIKKEYRRIGLSYDEDTYINTADQKYYKWTQWLFLKLYEKGLAYRAKEETGYCPDCKTVISKEQVIEDGSCERCGAEIENKELTQWYFKITEYAEELATDIDKLNWQETGKKLHKNWIGKEIQNGKATYRLHDWCISRQRYWGTPIPIVYCNKCGEQPVPLEELPVALPHNVDFIPTGTAPLKKHKNFHENGKCPLCGEKAKREVDVMDTFVSSSWYFYRYFDPHNIDKPFDPEKVNQWIPFNWYQGAQEHYTAHLVYARFIAKFLADIGYLEEREPVKNYISCGLVVAKDGGKFSKRLANAPDLNEELKKYGADTLRMFTQFTAPFEDDVPWDTEAIVGIQRFLNRIYRIGSERISSEKEDVKVSTLKKYNSAISKIEETFKTYKWNVAISKFMTLITDLNKYEKIDPDFWQKIIRMIAPFAPFIAEEMWEKSGGEGSVHEQDFPEKIENLNEQKQIKIVITVNGSKKDEFFIDTDSSENEIINKAREITKKYDIDKATEFIYVKHRLINFITG